MKDSVLTDLGLPGNPDRLLAEHVVILNATYRAVAGRLAANTAVSIDGAETIHVASVKAIEEPPSLVDLRERIAAMVPRVDISEAILEVLGWCPQFLTSLTSIAGNEPHLADMDITVAACLTGQGTPLRNVPPGATWADPLGVYGWSGWGTPPLPRADAAVRWSWTMQQDS